MGVRDGAVHFLGLRAKRRRDAPPACCRDRSARGQAREAHLAGFGERNGATACTTPRPTATDPKARWTFFSRHRARSTSTWSRCSRGHLEEPRRTACAPTSCNGWPTCKPAFHALPRRLHRRGPRPGQALPVEDHDRRPVAERKLIINRWNDEFKHRPAPDYYPVVRPRLLRVLPALRGHRRRAAADPQLRHGLPVQLRRTRAARPSSIPTSRTRST